MRPALLALLLLLVAGPADAIPVTIEVVSEWGHVVTARFETDRPAAITTDGRFTSAIYTAEWMRLRRFDGEMFQFENARLWTMGGFLEESCCLPSAGGPYFDGDWILQGLTTYNGARLEVNAWLDYHTLFHLTQHPFPDGPLSAPDMTLVHRQFVLFGGDRPELGRFDDLAGIRSIRVLVPEASPALLLALGLAAAAVIRRRR